jgi:hypothetical protein
MGILSGRTGVGEIGAMFRSPQSIEAARSFGALSSDRALELVWGSGEVPYAFHVRSPRIHSTPRLSSERIQSNEK